MANSSLTGSSEARRLNRLRVVRILPTHCSIILIHLNRDLLTPRADVALALPRIGMEANTRFPSALLGSWLRVCWVVGSVSPVDDCIAHGELAYCFGDERQF